VVRQDITGLLTAMKAYFAAHPSVQQAASRD